MFDDDPTLVEGEMTVTSKGRTNRGNPGSADFNTLDEPIKETIVSRLEKFADIDELAMMIFPFPRSFGMFSQLAVNLSMFSIQKRKTVC
jgi:hypothetical protein